MENKKLIIFDFDGVLVNTKEFWFKIQKDANGDFTMDKFEEMNSGNFLHNQESLISKGQYIRPQNPEVKFVNALNNVFSIDDVLHDAVLHLASLYTLCICSSASANVISGFLKKENVSECFTDVLGYENHSSKIVKINSLLEKHSVAPLDTVFITDTLGDILEGKECGVKMLAVTWGFHRKEILEKGSPEAIISDPRELLPTIENMLK